MIFLGFFLSCFGGFGGFPAFAFLDDFFGFSWMFSWVLFLGFPKVFFPFFSGDFC